MYMYTVVCVCIWARVTVTYLWILNDMLFFVDAQCIVDVFLDRCYSIFCGHSGHQSREIMKLSMYRLQKVELLKLSTNIEFTCCVRSWETGAVTHALHWEFGRWHKWIHIITTSTLNVIGWSVSIMLMIWPDNDAENENCVIFFL